MKMGVTFAETNQSFNPEFGEVYKVCDGKAAVIEPLEVTANGEYTAPDGVDGYSPVVVSVPVPDGYIKPSGNLEITENGTYDVAEKASVTVDVATGGGIKFLARPASTTSFVIENPFGESAQIVVVTRISTDVTSNRKIHKCIISNGLKFGAVEAIYTDGRLRYAIVGVDSGVNNAQFMVTDNAITLYRYNSATTWDDTSDYEVTIYR